MRRHLHLVNRSMKRHAVCDVEVWAIETRKHSEASYRVDGSGLVWTDGSDYERFDPCALRAGCNGHVSSLASDVQVHDVAICEVGSRVLAAKAAGIWSMAGDCI